jgi:alpha-glucosidase
MLSKNNLVLYEIYPQSFKDSTGNGYGDLKGIISKLDYFKDLGINALWITPFYPSPMKDGGYDISDYCDVSPEFGTLEDFKDLVKESHARDIQVITDLVINHTSDQHPWFIESRSSRDNPKRNWYIWKDPVDGGVPNNWMSVFEPTPWEFDIKTNQYYFHSFLKEQPDLNWTNPEVMDAVKNIMKFWLDIGVDGFRMDAANYMWKDQRFLDEPQDPAYKEGEIQPFYKLKHIYMRDQEKLFDIIGDLGEFLDAQGKGFIITESYLNKKGIDAIAVYKQYYNSIKSANVIPFNFEFIRLPWTASAYADFVTAYLNALDQDELPTFVFGNHDKSRIATRIGFDQAKVAAVLLLTLPGMPVIYYGDELGMEDVHIPPEKIHDTKEITSPGFGRDPVRTPMQWDSSNNGGFTIGTPWLPLEDDYGIKNVAVENEDPDSMLTLYKSLLKLKMQDKAFIEGKYELWNSGNENVFSYLRVHPQSTKLMLLNFTDKEQICRLPFESCSIILSTKDNSTEINHNEYRLKPNEACILEGNSLNSR